ncbi:G-protein coupled receptor Mth2-like isoform X2 [Daktulosphaira vitifoliae]|uniref:G-protein coupled receptor Mth2-like isoform X2 n=1 Tax=Daktulosphaira vitifoliae TaxID=58002 RepID=UPI0021AAF35D|nr:G-protein coupled receptor Mth2-like isoform X2 [Daktulosphaira vitifoliae]
MVKKIKIPSIPSITKSWVVLIFVLIFIIYCSDVSLSEVYIHKCCNRTTQYKDNKICIESKDIPPLRIPSSNDGLSNQKFHENETFKVILGSPCEFGHFIIEPNKNKGDSFSIDPNTGVVSSKAAGIYKPNEYCVEFFGTGKDDIAINICLPVTEITTLNDGIRVDLILTVLMILSVPFLIITFTVFACIKKLRNFHGKSLMCHVISLIVAYISLAFTQLNSSLSKFACFCSAYIIQFSFLASFFWLNVMCFDLWWTFSGCRPMRGRAKERDSKKFILHSIYAWGGPLIIFFITFYMELSTSLNSTEYQPDFGLRSCWFHTKTATLIYFYGPIGVILLANSLMFIHTALMILKHMREAKVLQGSESKKSVDHEKQKFLLYFKLFLVMGVNWLAEIISWAFDNQGHWWYVTDIGNALQGVLIFLIFVCKKRVLRLVNKKFCPGVEIVKSSTVVSNRTTSSTYTQSTVVPKDSVEMNTHLVSDFKA